MEILDISPPVSERTAVFPGDVPYSREVSLDWASGHHLELSSLRSTLHVGAHTDAPVHYHPEGADIASQDLSAYLGPCRVIRVEVAPGARITPEDLAGAPLDAPRVLLRTDSYPDPERGRDDFASLSPELVDHLADAGARLVGIDTPRVHPADSKRLESHRRLFARGLVNLEGLWLREVEPGPYTLVALPLRLVGADASPVRAVLLRGAIP